MRPGPATQAALFVEFPAPPSTARRREKLRALQRTHGAPHLPRSGRRIVTLRSLNC